MARPKAFDVDQALERAMELFWRQGYLATSLPDLVEHMGIGRQSLYDTFGDKRQLFLQALDRYAAVMIGGALGRLEEPGASLDDLKSSFTATTFYDGQGIIVNADSPIQELADLEGTTICVTGCTTTEINLATRLGAAGIND